jgi:hypothetical protein
MLAASSQMVARSTPSSSAGREETGGLSLEWVAVILGILTIAGIVVAIVVQKATSAANKIQIP